ncbi:MAG: glycosyltransferase family 39 protein [Patescibacteria group bacterium]
MDDSLNYTELRTHKKSKYFYLLIALIIFHVIANITWIILNNQPPTWDAGLHTVLSFKIYESFSSLFTVSSYYPPFVHVIGSIFVSILGYSFKSVELTGTLFFVTALIYIYLYTKELIKSPKIAFFSALFFSLFITIFDQSRYHMLDIPLTAMVVGSLYYLEKSDNLIKKRPSMLFFLFFALAILTKWYAVIFITIPLVFRAIELIKNREYFRVQIKNILLGLVVFLVLVLPWYLINLNSLINIAAYTSTAELADPQSRFSIENILFYPKLIIIFQTSFLGFIFFIVSLVFFIKNSINKQKLLIFLSILFIYSVFTLIANKNIRYLIPMMPFVAIIMGFGADWILKKGKFLSSFLFSATITYLVLSYFILSFGFPIYPNYQYAFNFPILGWTDVYYLNDHPIKIIYEDNQKLPYSNLVEEISSLIDNDNVRTLTLVDTPYINDYLLNPKLYFKDSKAEFNITEYFPLNKVDDINKFLNDNVDVIITSKNYIGLEGGIREYKSVKRFHEFVLSGKLKNFEKVKEYELIGDEYHPNDTIILLKKVF